MNPETCVGHMIIIKLIIMEQLKQILVHKLELIQQLKAHQQNSSPMHELYQQLKKQRQIIKAKQQRQPYLIQLMLSNQQNATDPEEFYRLSLTLMKKYDAQYQPKIIHTFDRFQIVACLYSEFFQRNNDSARAELVFNIFQKKLYQKSVMLIIMLKIFSEWLRKVFKMVIKWTLNDNNPIAVVSSSFKQQRKKTKGKQDDLKINVSLSLKPSKAQFSLQMSLNQSLIKAQVLERQKSEQKQIRQIKFLRNQSKLEYSFAEKQLNRKRSECSSIMKSKETLQTIHEKDLYSKQLFTSAFLEEINIYYKLISCIDLDESLLKKTKKTENRKNLLRNLSSISRVMAKNQPSLITTSIQSYFNKYTSKFKKPIQINKRSISLKQSEVKQRKECIKSFIEKTQAKEETRSALEKSETKHRSYLKLYKIVDQHNINQQNKKKIEAETKNESNNKLENSLVFFDPQQAKIRNSFEVNNLDFKFIKDNRVSLRKKHSLDNPSHFHQNGKAENKSLIEHHTNFEIEGRKIFKLPQIKK